MADQIDASFKLSERTALLTGPCTTINQAIASKLTSLGCNVALVDRNIDKSQRFAEQLMNEREIHERYGRAVAIQADLSKSHHVQDAASRAAESFGGLDIYIDGLLTTDVREFRDPSALEDIDRLIDVNLRAPLMMTHAILKFLEGRKRGRIIYLQHDIIRLGIEKNGLLAATRGGLSDFARTLSREVAPNNVTVNVVNVGVNEEFLLQQSPLPSSQTRTSINDSLAMLKQSFPRATMIDPDKVANFIAFLASPLGSAMTGQTISINQGLA